MAKKKELPGKPEPLSQTQVKDLRAQMLDMGLPSLLVDKLLELIDSTGPAWGYCPECRKKVQVDLPIWKYRIDAIRICLDHTVGKPAERKVVQHTGIFDDLTKLTDNDLENLLKTEE